MPSLYLGFFTCGLLKATTKKVIQNQEKASTNHKSNLLASDPTYERIIGNFSMR